LTVLVTDKLRSYGAAMKVIRNADKQETGRWLARDTVEAVTRQTGRTSSKPSDTATR